MRKLLFLLIGCIALTTFLRMPSVQAQAVPMSTVFVIVMENKNWNQIKGSSSAPYINSLLTKGAHAEAYYNPPGMHPSETDYMWLEAGTNLGITNNNDPSINHRATTAHLTTLLNTAGISWKSYQENISGTVCPLVNTGLYAVRHNPMVFFDDVTGVNNPQSSFCIAHVRPYTELSTDLASGNVAKYNFITPNLCNDMHNTGGCPTRNAIKNGDNWLKQEIPKLLASNAYTNGGIIFITWDEGESSDGPIGMIVLSPLAKVGYSNTIHYTHSSTVRTLQELFGVTPLLADAANATDLSNLFQTFPSILPVPPPNDNFANSIPIPNLTYSNIQNNAVASLESLEQKSTCEPPTNITNTVWYKYTATANQPVTFSVSGSFWVKGISVWTGTNLGALTEMSCSKGANASAKVNTTSGTVYYIRVGGSNGVGGNFRIQVGLPPPNDDFTNAMVVDTGFAPFTDAEDVIGASLQPGDLPTTCSITPTFRSVWYKYNSLGNTTLNINTTGSDFDTVLSVWTGAGLGALTQVPLACNDNAGGIGVTTSALTVLTTPGVTYFIRVSSQVGTPTHLTFNLLPSSTISSPPIQNYFTTATPTLSWNKITGATLYTIQVSKSPTFGVLAFPSVVVPSDQLSITIGVDNSPHDPLPEGVYYWRVSANNGVTWSAIGRFVINLP